MTLTVSAVVIARDEQAMLPDCLASLRWADEVLVLVDAATRDGTREVARAHGARVEERALDTFAGQREAALRLARGAWVLFVDADERVPPGLAAEVRRTVASPRAAAGYRVPRRNHMLGRVMRGGGWYPDYQLRLLRVDRARFDAGQAVHEVALLDGPLGTLREPLEHLSHPSLRAFLAKQERYSRLAAAEWLRQHGRPRPRALLGQPLREAWRRIVTLRGYRDGPIGILLGLVLAWYTGRAVWLARRLTPPASPSGRVHGGA